MSARTGYKNLLLAVLLFFTATGCGHRHGDAVVAQSQKHAPKQPSMLTVLPSANQTYKSSPAAIQFDYPACWHQCKSTTADFTIADAANSSICLDIPKLPWHIPGMIPLGMVASGYVDDLRKNQIHDAIVQEQVLLKVCDAPARRVTCAGHINGKPAIDVAVIMIHADRVYILSADSDDTHQTVARQTLDDAVTSLKWAK